MEWRDEGIILAVRRHGETSAIVDILTREHGRSLGLVRGGRSRTMRPVLQAGNSVSLSWRARLEEHLGNFTLDPIKLRAGFIIENPARLAGLVTLAGLSQFLPERESHQRIYDAGLLVLDAIEDDHLWPALLARWEMGLLDELGFGLDLERCAATGSRDELVYVSPKSGKAVSRMAGEAYRDKLFALPSFLSGGSEANPAEVTEAFRITGYFLDRHVADPRGAKLPASRETLLAWLKQMPQ
ncbi:MAG: DNA repair protein RecO [Aestuariivirga sp.]